MRKWVLFFLSLATWPLLYGPGFLLSGGGIGAFAFMKLYWWPGIVIANAVLVCMAAAQMIRRRPSQIANGLTIAHSAFFVAISLPYMIQ